MEKANENKRTKKVSVCVKDMKLDKQITMPKVMKMITAIGILVTLVTMIIYQNNNSSIFLTLAITFGTITIILGCVC